MKITTKLVCAKDDPEKALIPSIVLCYGRLDGVAGFSLTFGWWHYGVSTFIGWCQNDH